MADSTGKAFDYKVLKRTLGYVKPYRGIFLLTGLITILLSVLAPVRTLLIQKAIDEHIQVGDVPGLEKLMVILVGLLVLHAVFQFLQAYLTNWLGQAIILDLRKLLFRHVVAFKLKYFDNHPIGSLVTRVTSDIQSITEIFSQGLLNIISDILQLVVVLGFMFYINPFLALIILIPIPLLIWSTNVFQRVVKDAFTEVRSNVSKINTFIQEHVTGMKIVQIFNREQEEMRRFKSVNAAHRDGWIKTVWANAFFFPVVEILSACSIALLVWWGARGVTTGHVKIGEIMAFVLFIHMLYRPIRQLADRFSTLQMGMVASGRVFKVLDTEAKIEDSGKVTQLEIQGKIDFKNVCFAYKEGVEVLKNVSFEVAPGETLALVGATGAGKSSVINVLTRFYEIQSGEILIDGRNIHEFTLEFLRRITAVVLQDVFLFDDSIYNNITLGRKNITRAEVIEAARLIGAHDFIEALPGGYDYVVRERGVILSVGQRQLLAFLRAYVYNPQILILDEATSSIDTETEGLIQNATQELTKGRTSIVIAHRLSTIQNANKILVMDKGEVVEEGNHESLLKLNGYYKKLYEYQFAQEVSE